VQDISVLIQDFRNAAYAQAQATLKGESKKTQVTSVALQKAEKRLFKNASESDMPLMMALLRDPDAGVRLYAAMALFDQYNLSQAKWVLRKISWFRRDELGLLAKMKLWVIKNEKKI
jgi:hypothetical protein